MVIIHPSVVFVANKNNDYPTPSVLSPSGCDFLLTTVASRVIMTLGSIVREAAVGTFPSLALGTTYYVGYIIPSL
jgi:hypothetical protein